MLHGRGSIYWPRGQIMDGIWDRGRLTQMRYTFADGLLYQEDEWNYCTFPDRRLGNLFPLINSSIKLFHK